MTFTFEEEQASPEPLVYLHRLYEGLTPYIDIQELRRLVIEQDDIYKALRCSNPPLEVQALLATLTTLLRPDSREQIRRPTEVAGMLMVEMGHLDQEELRTVLLDTKNRVQDIVTIYRGSLNTSLIRVGEVYKEALRRNSAALIVVHNHPSGDPTPSPEDVLVTQQIVSAGQLLDVECLDHLVIGRRLGDHQYHSTSPSIALLHLVVTSSEAGWGMAEEEDTITGNKLVEGWCSCHCSTNQSDPDVNSTLGNRSDHEYYY